jgi:arginine decarboxylase
LHYVQYSADELLAQMRRDVEKAVRANRISLSEARLLLRFYENGLEGYTYLEEP